MFGGIETQVSVKFIFRIYFFGGEGKITKYQYNRNVRAQDRLTFFQLIPFGAFSYNTSRGLLYMQTYGFIAKLPRILVSATQAPLASLMKMKKPPEPLRPSSASHVSAAQPPPEPRNGASAGPG